MVTFKNAVFLLRGILWNFSCQYRCSMFYVVHTPLLFAVSFLQELEGKYLFHLSFPARSLKLLPTQTLTCCFFHLICNRMGWRKSFCHCTREEMWNMWQHIPQAVLRSSLRSFQKHFLPGYWTKFLWSLNLFQSFKAFVHDVWILFFFSFLLLFLINRQKSFLC